MSDKEAAACYQNL